MYESLCVELLSNGYSFVRFCDFATLNNDRKSVIMRHDVDRNPAAALAMAIREHRLGINTSYYFRAASASHDTIVIREVAKMGHEIGYHYEDLTGTKGDYDKAIVNFERNIAEFRQICDVRTVSMHGSPLSRWDNRLLWQRYDYRDYGIIGEPYFDIDFKEFLYLTDTGRRWNSAHVNIRDRAHSSRKDRGFRSTDDIIDAVRSVGLSAKIMLNVHPQRWHDRYIPWLRELVWQNAKNVAKRLLVDRHREPSGT